MKKMSAGNMDFKKTNLPTGTAYIRGIYKCVKYGDHWFAFYKPKGQRSWGYSCEHDINSTYKSMKYESLEEAKAACERHAAKNKEY
jgi:hypothetical protein